jgi:uncharacterized iron-regulated protein
MKKPLAAACLALALGGPVAAAALAPTGWPPDVATGLQSLLPARVLLIGEQHDAPEHQRLQAAIVAHLAGQGQLQALVLEMAEQGRNTQGLPPTTSPDAVRQQLGWQDPAWPWERYGPVVMAAVGAGVVVHGGNLPRAAMRAAMQQTALDQTLPADQRAALEALIHTAHCELLPASQLPAMARIQIGRDVAMAETLLGLQTPGKVVVLVTGRQHARKDHGVPWHLHRIDPSLPSAQVQVLDLRTPGAPPLASDAVWPTPPAPPHDHCAGLRERWATPHRPAPTGP